MFIKQQNHRSSRIWFSLAGIKNTLIPTEASDNGIPLDRFNIPDGLAIAFEFEH